jgi:anti-sigma factor RsiW
VDRALNHDDIASLLGAYSLDAVEADEAAIIAEHLSQCPRCAAEVAEHREVVGLVANAGVDAPPEIWDRIAQRIAPSQPARGRVAVSSGLRAGTAEPRAARRWAWSLAVTAAAAAAAVIAVLGVQVSNLDHRVGQLAASSERSGLTQSVQAALLDPRAHQVTLMASASGAARAGRAVVLVLLPDGSAFALNTGLPRLEAGRTYQLWGAVGNRLVSLGLLGSQPQDVAFRVDPGATIRSFAVTAEVAGGVVQSSHAPVAQSTA